MFSLKQKLDELLEEKRARAGNEKPAVKERPPDLKEKPAGSWDRFNGLSDSAIVKKLEALLEKEMLSLYKKFEKHRGLRIDPENCRPEVIIKNFMLLWGRKIKDEAYRKRNPIGAPLGPLTGDEIDRIWATGSGGIGRASEPGSRLHFEEDNDSF